MAHPKPIYKWVEVKIDADATMSDMERAVSHAMADDGDVPIHAVGDYRRTALEIGYMRAALQFVRIFKEVVTV